MPSRICHKFSIQRRRTSCCLFFIGFQACLCLFNNKKSIYLR